MQAVADKLMAPAGQDALAQQETTDVAAIIQECFSLSERCMGKGVDENLAALQESLEAVDPAELRACSNGDWPLALNFLLAAAQNIPIEQVSGQLHSAALLPGLFWLCCWPCVAQGTLVAVPLMCEMSVGMRWCCLAA